MKSTRIILTLVTFCISIVAWSQKKNSNAGFQGAVATLKSYKALYILNQSDDKKIRAVIRNINNAMEDPRLKGKLEAELVVFGDGVEVFKKSNNYDTLLLKLQQKGVILAQCLNTLKERKINKDELWPFISYVPTANGEIIIRQYQGWATIHP